MLGKNNFKINQADFIKGESSGVYVSDGGFSPNSEYVNPFNNVGAIYGSGSATVLTTSGLTNYTVIGSTGGTVNANPAAYRFLLCKGASDTQINWAQESYLGKNITDSGTVMIGRHDIVTYKGYVYWGANGSAAERIARISEDGSTGHSANWSGALTGNVPHPMLVWEKNLWIADTNEIDKYDGTTKSNGVLVLNEYEIITALGTDQRSGLMLIATVSGNSTGSALGRQSKANHAKIYEWNGTSVAPSKSSAAPGVVTSFIPYEGNTYVAYDNKLGYYNGSGVTFLRKLGFTITSTSMAWKQKTSITDGKIFISDNGTVLGFGDTLAGTKAFAAVLGGSTDRTFVGDWGGTKLASATGAGSITVTDLNTAHTSWTFQTNRYRFEQPIWIRGVKIRFTSTIPAGTSVGQLYVVDRVTGVSTAMGNIKNNNLTAATSLIEIQYDYKTSEFSLNLPMTADYGIEEITVYYDGTDE